MIKRLNRYKLFLSEALFTLILTTGPRNKKEFRQGLRGVIYFKFWKGVRPEVVPNRSDLTTHVVIWHPLSLLNVKVIKLLTVARTVGYAWTTPL